MADSAVATRGESATGASAYGAATVGAVGRVFVNETYKNLLMLWAYRKTLIPEVALAGFMYLALQFFIGGGEMVDELIPATSVAYVTYLFTYYVLLKVVSGLLEEINTGTFEQTHISPLPSWALSLSRIGAAMVQGAAVTLVVAAAFIVGLDIDFPLTWHALVPVGVTVLDVVGFALVIGGLALSVASIGAVLHVIQGVVMILNGSLVPVETLPGGLEVIARLVPGTLGIEATRATLFEGVSVAAAWSHGDLLPAAVHAAVMLVLGSVVYQWNIRKGLENGRLGP